MSRNYFIFFKRPDHFWSLRSVYVAIIVVPVNGTAASPATKTAASVKVLLNIHHYHSEVWTHLLIHYFDLYNSTLQVCSEDIRYMSKIYATIEKIRLNNCFV